MSKGRIAGAGGKTATPIGNEARIAHYRRQNGTDRLTPAQRRRVRKRENRTRGKGNVDE